MIRALPTFQDGRAALEFRNISHETVSIRAATAYSVGQSESWSGMEIDGLAGIELKSGEARSVDITTTLVKLMEALRQKSARIHVLLTLEPNVNSGKDDGRNTVGYENGHLTEFQ